VRKVSKVQANLHPLSAMHPGASDGAERHHAGLSYVQQGSSIPESPSDAEKWPSRGTVQKCENGRWIVWMCADGHMMNQWQGCGRLDCINCVACVSRQRATRIWDDIGELANEWGWWVLTAPLCARTAIGALSPSALRRLGAETVREWWTAQGYAGTGCVSYVHPVGSVYVCAACDVRVKKNDDESTRCTSCGKTMKCEDDTAWNPHVNVGTPLVDVTDGNVRLIWKKRPMDALNNMRVLWRQKLSDALGFDVGEVNTHYHFRVGARHIRHALRYFARSFPGWSSWCNTRGGCRYGAIGNRSLAATTKAIAESSVGLTVHAVSLMQCAQCGAEVKMAGITGVMPYSALGPVGAEHLPSLSGTAPPGERWRMELLE